VEGKHFRKPIRQALPEKFRIRDRCTIDIRRDATDISMRDEGNHRGASGERAESVKSLDSRSGDKEFLTKTWNIARL